MSPARSPFERALEAQNPRTVAELAAFLDALKDSVVADEATNRPASLAAFLEQWALLLRNGELIPPGTSEAMPIQKVASTVLFAQIMSLGDPSPGLAAPGALLNQDPPSCTPTP